MAADEDYEVVGTVVRDGEVDRTVSRAALWEQGYGERKRPDGLLLKALVSSAAFYDEEERFLVTVTLDMGLALLHGFFSNCIILVFRAVLLFLHTTYTLLYYIFPPDPVV